MASGRTRWGIASAGSISSDFTTALLMLPKEHEVVAVAARDLKRAQEFANKFNIPKAYGSYEDLARDTNIDVVYIGCIHPQHHRVCQIMINAGKNILCEKPVTMNAKQAVDILSQAKKKQIFFAEGMWTRHFPAYKQLKREIQAGVIGDVRFVNVNFGIDICTRDRIMKKELGGGALLDIGCYGVQFAQFIFGEKPHKIVSTGTLNEEGVDISAVVTLHYSEQRMAHLNIHAGCQLDNKALVGGGKGIIEVPYFWNASELILPGGRFEEPLPTNPPFPMVYQRSEGFVYEAQGIRDCLNRGVKECEVITHEETLTIMEIMDEVRKQLGVVYEADLQ